MDLEPKDKLRLPIDEFQDVLVHAQVTADRPTDAYYGASVASHHQVDNLAEGRVEPTPLELENASYGLALVRELIDCESLSVELDKHSTVDPYNYRSLDARTAELVKRGIDTNQLKAKAESLSAHDVLERFVSQLEDAYEHLINNAALTLQTKVYLMDMLSMADILSTAVKVLPKTDEMRELWQARFNTVVANLSTGLMEHDKEGLGTAFGDLNRTPEWTQQFIPLLVARLKGVREVEGDDSYRRLYNYATSRLHEPQLNIFLAQLAKESTQPIFGSKVEYGGTFEHPYMLETFEEGELVRARLSEGSSVALPYINYRIRTVLGYGTTRESEVYEAQNAVCFEELSEAAKAAVEAAIRIDDLDLLRTETLPHYKRLAFWSDPDGRRLYTVSHRDGFHRRIDFYPDDHGFVTSDTERKLDNPVQEITHVMDGFLVVRYDGGYMYETSYKDAEVNFFGPQDGSANAFWVMGNPRRVWSKVDPRMSVPSKYLEGESENRFTIMPVRFLKVVEDIEAGEREREEEFRAELQELAGRTALEN